VSEVVLAGQEQRASNAGKHPGGRPTKLTRARGRGRRVFVVLIADLPRRRRPAGTPRALCVEDRGDVWGPGTPPGVLAPPRLKTRSAGAACADARRHVGRGETPRIIPSGPPLPGPRSRAGHTRGSCTKIRHSRQCRQSGFLAWPQPRSAMLRGLGALRFGDAAC